MLIPIWLRAAWLRIRAGTTPLFPRTLKPGAVPLVWDHGLELLPVESGPGLSDDRGMSAVIFVIFAARRDGFR